MTHTGKYRLGNKLGTGGMAEVYEGTLVGAEGFSRPVAIKHMLTGLCADPEFEQMFLNEARLASGLNHSGIAQVMDFGTEAGEHFMTLEYVHGRSVLQLLREAGRALPRAVALTIIHEVAGALHYAHERNGSDGQRLGLVHRDVSPSNVLVSYDGDVKLVDFGIAKATAHSQATQTAAIKGKIAYMAPEQLRGDTLDRRSDVFALCVVFYELVLGKRCFSAPGEFALINRVAEARFTKPSKVDPAIEPELEALISEGLSADPDGRPKSARELQLRIEALATTHELRLSKVALAEFMEKTFGVVDFPRTDSLPLPAVWPAEPASAVVEATPIPRARASWPWIVVALAVGVTGGIAAVTMTGDPAPEAKADAVDSGPTPAAVVSEPPIAPSAPKPEDAAAPVEPDEPDEPEVIVEPEPPEPARPSRKKKRRRRTATKDKPVDKPSLDADYLPPSRRSG